MKGHKKKAPQVTLLPAGNPWDQYPNEPYIDYLQFQRFLSIPQQDRSLGQYCKVSGKAYGSIARLSSQWEWLDRAAAYDSSREAHLLDQLEIRQTQASELIYNTTRELYEAFREDVQQAFREGTLIQTELVKAEVEEQYRGANGDAEVVVHVEVRQNLDAFAAIARTLEKFNKELRISVGLPSSISSSRIDVKKGLDENTLNTLEDLVEQRQKLLEDSDNG